MDLAQFRGLIEETLRIRGWSLNQLGRESDIQPSVISRWLSVPKGSKVSRPSPANLDKLAPLVGMPHEELMRMCGYLTGKPAAANAKNDERLSRRQQAIRAQRDRWVDVLGPTMGADAAEDYFWETLKQHTDSILGVVERTGTAVNADASTAVNRVVSEHPKRGRRRRNNGEGPLTVRQREVNELHDTRLSTSGAYGRQMKQRLAA